MALDPETIRKLARMTLDTRPDDICCAEWIHLVGEYVEATHRGGSLDARLLVVERHAKACRSCADELEVLRRLVADEGS